MSEWRGLHNPERHFDDGGDSLPECWDCETECLASRPCRCCLAAEVADRDQRIAAALALLQPDAGGWCDCLAHRIGRALRGES